MAAVPMVLALGLLLGCAAAAAGVPAVPAAAITSSASSASSSSYRLAYTTYTDAGGVVVQIAEGTLGGSGSPRITPGVVSIPGDSRGAGQLSLSPNGLAYVVWRTGSICAANPDPEHRKGCWALETWSLEARQGQPLVALQGDAGLAGQPAWSPDGAKNATFCAIYIQNASFYQDRLGTNIGKTPKKSGVFRRAIHRVCNPSRREQPLEFNGRNRSDRRATHRGADFRPR